MAVLFDVEEYRGLRPGWLGRLQLLDKPSKYGTWTRVSKFLCLYLNAQVDCPVCA